MLKEKAKSFAESLGIKGFGASEGWLSNFKNRHSITFKKICGESASVDSTVCNEWTDKLKELLNGYEPKDIFNTDETGLSYKCLPDRTLTFRNEKWHGGKHSKERITVLLACNMDGSQKLNPLVIGKSAKPRCFKGIKSLPTIYRSNKKSWITTELFNEWLISVDSDMKKENRKILLFLDNCSVHNNPPQLDNVKLIFFPPSTTSGLQPLDQGIIHNFKTIYRREIVSIVLDSIENGETANLTVLTAILTIHKIWKNVSPLFTTASESVDSS
ncbi:tigger transposable element-derived protein 6-like [Nilaparvata lugens]|uniref:tigger transposable element-derived protein 6-like n=1 Tax=Nilaparvata lugens TaxID=108931 RepID=UPI00193CDB14|nr:tigger transposable element-derived protein 6-like [Nilaparvata lugens]